MATFISSLATFTKSAGESRTWQASNTLGAAILNSGLVRALCWILVLFL
jgi:hypothetical protein